MAKHTESVTIRIDPETLKRLKAHIARQSAIRGYRRITISEAIRTALAKGLVPLKPAAGTRTRIKL